MWNMVMKCGKMDRDTEEAIKDRKQKTDCSRMVIRPFSRDCFHAVNIVYVGWVVGDQATLRKQVILSPTLPRHRNNASPPEMSYSFLLRFYNNATSTRLVI